MAPTYFSLRPSSGSLQLSLAKVILILKHSVKLHHYLSCGGVAACPGMACVLCAVQSTAHLLVNELWRFKIYLLFTVYDQKGSCSTYTLIPPFLQALEFFEVG